MTVGWCYLLLFASCLALALTSHPVQVNINGCLVEAGVAQWTRGEGTGGRDKGAATVVGAGVVTRSRVSEQQSVLDDSGQREVMLLVGRGRYWCVGEPTAGRHGRIFGPTLAGLELDSWILSMDQMFHVHVPCQYLATQ